jgi:predicted ATPase
MAETDLIRTPDQRLRVFVSSTLGELAAERRAVRDAVTRLRLVPVMFELAARSHPPRLVYRAYLAQSQVFVGLYWQRYGWIAPGEELSGLEDEYLLGAGLPRLIYVKSPAADRDARLTRMLDRMRDDADVSYQHFSEPEELQGLVENDLAVLLSEHFPSARPGDRKAGASAEEEPLALTLPAAVTPLVGRDQEALAVCDLMMAKGARLLTLTGPGGVGKSRLAIEVAGRLSPRFDDGVRFVDLATVTASEQVAGTIAADLGLSTSGGLLLADLKSYLRRRRLLLVLDNFEQVSDAAPLVAELLAESPGLAVLVTSRMVLRLSGEHEFAVATLPVPPLGTGQDSAEARQYAAVRLFAERARAALTGFELTDANAGDVAEICRRVDGLPLAIELAAARVRLLPPRALLARLDDRLGLLTGGARDLPERQRTLRTTLDWSFSLLDPPERALFPRLGVFAGTFSLAAAEAVCGDDLGAVVGSAAPASPVIDVLGALVDASLVRPEGPAGEPRFRLLDTIREYALERLHGSAVWGDAHDRHAAYFAAIAEPAEPELSDPGQLAWLNRLETEHENLSSAMSWLLDQDRVERVLQLGWATWKYWWLRGHVADLVPVEDKLLARSESFPPDQRAMALSAAGFGLLARGDRAGGQELLERSLPLFRHSGNKLDTARTLNLLGHLLASQGDVREASELLEESLGVLGEEGRHALAGELRVRHALAIAEAYNILGQVRLLQGDIAGAARLFTDGLDAARGVPDRFAILISLYDLALSNQRQGELASAAENLHEGLSLAAETGDEPSVAYYLEELAAIASVQDNPRRAVRLIAAARSLLETSGSGWLHAWVPRAPHDDDVLAALHSRISDTAFDEAWASGQADGGTSAVQHALDRDNLA